MLTGPQTGGWAQTIGHHLFELDRDGGGPLYLQLSFLKNEQYSI